MDFTTFRTACKWADMAFTIPDDHTKMGFVCRKKRPIGESWSKCGKEHCPYYGCAGREVKVYAGDKTIGTAERIRFVLE